MKQRIIGFLLVLSTTLLIAQGCRSPDNNGENGGGQPPPPQVLSGPGSRGDDRDPAPPPADTPDEQDASAVIRIYIDDEIPATLVCNTTYLFMADASELGVLCESYKYGFLYREALRRADERVAEIQCPNQCPQRNPYVVAQEGLCTNGQAEVSLSMAVQCLDENAPRIDGLPLRTDSELRVPFRDILPNVPQTNERLVIEIRPNTLAEKCPFDFKFWITLNERVNSCDAVADYAPFVAKVERQAAKIWQDTRCGPNCTRAQLREVGARWSCAQNVVTVSYAFQVPCRPN